jgi:twitching motility protein PilT|nr:PilT/PilU family type 4a pilus ATPase [Oxynema aestuarii]
MPKTPTSKPAELGQGSHSTLVKQMVKHAYAHKASDIHIRVGEIPRFRIRGQMHPAEGQVKVTLDMFELYLREILTPRQREEFAKNKELDTAIFYPGLVRCRVNCFETLTGGAIVLRLISLHVPSIEELGLPPVLKKIISLSQGLVLVTGPTGSGKSTTLAAMIRHLNENAYKHIISIEDPIEYVHASERCLVSQREVGLHTHDFHSSLRSALREDPDVVLIGEMRDRTTINTALQAAQTGHLVLGTLHTRNAINAVNRLLNLFPPEDHQSMRIQIVESLAAVVAQLLVPTTEGGRTAIHDVLINTPAIQDYLFKGEDDEAFYLMRTDTHEGMQVMNNDLYQKVMTGRIALEEAEKVSPDPSELDRLMRTGGFDASKSVRDFSKSSR